MDGPVTIHCLWLLGCPPSRLVVVDSSVVGVDVDGYRITSFANSILAGGTHFG
jgi:hypothetical protein